MFHTPRTQFLILLTALGTLAACAATHKPEVDSRSYAEEPSSDYDAPADMPMPSEEAAGAPGPATGVVVRPAPTIAAPRDAAPAAPPTTPAPAKVASGPAVLAPPVETEVAEPPPVANSEGYEDYGVNDFTDPKKDRLSTFAIDVDTASYTIARRKLNERRLPPQASVRVEEFVNFFNYDYARPDGDAPFAVHLEAAPSPFNTDTYFLRVGVQGADIDENTRAPIHLTFLVDTSGSMQSADKIGLVKQSLTTLVNNLKPGDTVAIATYAGWVAEVLPPTDARNKEKIIAALDGLSARGSTAMSSGLELAYKLAYKNLKPGHVNRVIVCSDGDANVGPSSHQQILERIRHFTQEGVTLSTIGFGMGNYKDVMMEQLANNGNGNYYYIDSPKEARRVFQDDLMGTLVVIAKDVKIQVEFDDEAVTRYRLIGYENRDVADKDFRNDAVDAGEIGAGHRVTALYEVELASGASRAPATVRLRAKKPDGGKANEWTFALDRGAIARQFNKSSRSFRLAVSVAAFAEVLRGSPHASDWELGHIREIAAAASRRDEEKELVGLIDRAIMLGDRAPGAGARLMRR